MRQQLKEHLRKRSIQQIVINAIWIETQLSEELGKSKETELTAG